MVARILLALLLALLLAGPVVAQEETPTATPTEAPTMTATPTATPWPAPTVELRFDNLLDDAEQLGADLVGMAAEDRPERVLILALLALVVGGGTMMLIRAMIGVRS